MHDPMLAAFQAGNDPRIVATYMHAQLLASKKHSELNRVIEGNLQKMGAQSQTEQ